MAKADIAGMCPECTDLVLEFEVEQGWCLSCGAPIKREDLLQPKDFL